MLLTTPFLMTNPNTVDKFAILVNRYGFMVIFCIVVLLLLIAFFVSFERHYGRKQDSEMNLLSKERNATIDQNKQMFDLVTKVQTEQVVQLREMTDSLREMNGGVTFNKHQLEIANEKYEKIQKSIDEAGDDHEQIMGTLSEILTYVKTNEMCNKEIIEKICLLENALMKKKDE